jgi:hypothetical protein
MANNPEQIFGAQQVDQQQMSAQQANVQQPVNAQQTGAQQAAYQQPGYYQQPVGKSAMGITGLVLGIIALLGSFLPIINNISAFLAFLGLIFAIVGIVACCRGTKSGKGLSIAGAIICVVAFVIVLATQSFYGQVLDEAVSGSSATGTSQTQQSTESSSEANSSQETTDLSIGTAVNMSDGLTISVDSVETGLTNYSGDEFTRISVTYVNNGKDKASFNMFDWSAQDAQGAERNSTYILTGDGADSSERLGSGELVAGGSVSGVVEFEGQITKAIYSPSILSDENDVTWVVE